MGTKRTLLNPTAKTHFIFCNGFNSKRLMVDNVFCLALSCFNNSIILFNSPIGTAVHIFSNSCLHLSFLFCSDNGSSVHSGVSRWDGNQDSTASDIIISLTESNDSNIEEQEEPKPCHSKYDPACKTCVPSYSGCLLLTHSYPMQRRMHNVDMLILF